VRAACRTIYAFGLVATAAALLASFVLPAKAQKYPDRPVKIVLPFGPGGVADVTARLVAEKLGDKVGQRFVIENMPGAGGISAANAVINAPSDGHTIGLVTNGTAISRSGRLATSSRRRSATPASSTSARSMSAARRTSARSCFG